MPIIYGASQTNTNVTGAANVLDSDDQYATIDHNDDQLKITGFSFTGTDLIKVVVGVEGLRANVGNGQVRISYEISGVPTGSSEILKFVSPSETTQFFDISNDRAWTDTDINNLTIVLDGHSVSASKSIDVDCVYLDLAEVSDGPLASSGEFKRFFVNGSPVHVVNTPTGNDTFVVSIQNLDENTQYLYIYHDGTVSPSNGWKLLPAQEYRTQCKGNTQFYVVFPDVVEEVEVSIHEI